CPSRQDEKSALPASGRQQSGRVDAALEKIGSLNDHVHGQVAAVDIPAVFGVVETAAISAAHRCRRPAGVKAIVASIGREQRRAAVEFTIERVIEQDEYAVLLATGKSIARTGRPYNNSYCIMARAVDDRLVELTDYVNTDLINRALYDETCVPSH